ncbi:Ycf66 family protein [Pelatocladus sp. BLCC-F211]|uniref:Ycf66 family protein n=1 Tax=Pelatocladus sp. BLCC-F211 TaxID=3342752 RepID=UPI0035B9307F
MLANVLALTVGLGSIAIYLAAFFFPEIHRKNDFIWSGVGLFYALMLWVFAPRITGGLLLGHIASVALLVWFGWQTLSLRRQLAPSAQQTPVPSTEAVQNTIQEQVTKLSLPQRLGQIQSSIGGIFSGAKNRVQQTVSKKTLETPQPTENSMVEIVDNRTTTDELTSEAGATVEPTDTSVTTDTEAKTETVAEAIPPHPPSPELVEAAKEAAVKAEEVVEKLENIPVEEIAPDAELAPPAEAPPEQIPPSDRAS